MDAGERFDLESWLRGLGLDQYAGAFRDNDIDGEVLCTLTSDDLREIGVASVGHRRKILDAAARRAGQRGAAPAAAPAEVPPSAAPAPTAERRQLTVMFCDLVDSTALSVRLDPEDYGELIAGYRTALEQSILPYRGHMSQFLGDGALIYFGYPQSVGHDAENAVGAGLAILEKIASLPPVAGNKLRVRIGIATGLTVVGAPDKMREMLGENAVGETPILAARLQALAAPNTLLVAPSTRELIGELFEYADLGLFDLKGFEQPIRLWQVLRQSGTTSRFDALQAHRRGTAFIGRETELARLRNRYAAAQAGQGQIVVITGDGGLGKSRLARQVLAEADTGRSEPLILQCTPYNVGSPLHPIRYYIARTAGIDSGDAPEAALQRLSALLARAGPVTAERLALMAEFTRIGGADLTPLQGLNSQELRIRTMRTLSSLLAAIAREASAIVAEDLQWIDPSTAELIENLLPVLRTMPVLLIGTMRPGPFPSWLAGAEARLIHLERLPHEDVRRLVESLAGANAVPAPVVEVIATRSDGVPIFVEELTRGYLETASRGEPTDNELSNIPSTLADSLVARLDWLKRGRKIVSIAAVLGREFPISVLVAVSGLPEQEVREGIGELLDADVVVAGHSAFGDAIAFRHMLVREAAYQLLLRRDRATMHARVANTLVTRFPAMAEALPHVLAIQFLEAGDFERAAAQWDRAGNNAAKRSAYSEAAAHFVRAIEANAKCDDSRARDERELAFRLDLLGAVIAARGFSSQSAGQEMEHAVRVSQRLGAKAKLIPALASKWSVLGGATNARAGYDLALQIREAAAEGSEIDRLIAHRILGTSLLFIGQFLRAIEEFELFLALFVPEKHTEELVRIGPSNHAIMVMFGLAEIYTLFAEFETAERWRVKALTTARESGRLHDICHTIAFMGCLLPAVRRQNEELARSAAELGALTTQHDLPFWRGHADLFTGLALIREGRADEGFVAARRGIKGLIASNAFANVWYILYAEACEAAGRIAEATEILALALPPLEHGEVWFAAEFHRVRARVELARGDGVEAARRGFQTALDIAQEQGARLFLR